LGETGFGPDLSENAVAYFRGLQRGPHKPLHNSSRAGHLK